MGIQQRIMHSITYTIVYQREPIYICLSSQHLTTLLIIFVISDIYTINPPDVHK